MRDFKAWCCLPNIHGAIGETHIYPSQDHRVFSQLTVMTSKLADIVWWHKQSLIATRNLQICS